MKSNASYNGFAVALAWPQTLCKQPGAWYDSLMGALGFCLQHYYKAGHAAVLLVEDITGQCHYYDFGRYHAPFGHGRVRSAATDHDLAVETRAILSDDKQNILNFNKILKELTQNPSCHGDGILYGAYYRVNFIKASDKAREMQEKSPLPYGPFVWNGTNCSRFVRTVILAGQPAFPKSLRLSMWMPGTPTPLGNVFNVGGTIITSRPVSEKENTTVNTPAKHIFKNRIDVKECLPKPNPTPEVLPRNVQWLSGEGAGSWFYIKPFGTNRLEVFRYSSAGRLECKTFMQAYSSETFDPEKPYRLLHLSHCKQLHLSQDDIQFIFTA